MTKKPPQLSRSAGILVHPTSLYTPYGIGDFGSAAIAFIDFLKEAGQKFWQILPLGPTAYADSPYQCTSAFAGNPILISPEKMLQMELVTEKDIVECFGVISLPTTESAVNSEDLKQWTIENKLNYDEVREKKDKLLAIGFKAFFKGKATQFKDEYTDFLNFCEEEKLWLEDYVLYFSLKKANGFKSWLDWKKPFVKRDENSIKVWTAGHGRELLSYKFIQWLFYKQWGELKKKANDNGIQIIGDMPIFVAHDSVDVWVHRELFTVDEKTGVLILQAGVPPDYFSKTGQLWGNPLYDWEKMQNTNFEWFVRRFRQLMKLFDWIRVDHFRGFEAYWEILAEEETAINGKWVKALGKELFEEVQRQLGNLPILAEDLGVITPEVEALRDEFNFPGMKVLQFAFSNSANNPHLPHNYVVNSLAYTATHDNDTTLGWWENHATKENKSHLKKYLNFDGKDVVKDLIRLLYGSVATLAIIPIQDVLEQSSEARMNIPSTMGGNWQFQMKDHILSPNHAEELLELAKIFGRIEEN